MINIKNHRGKTLYSSAFLNMYCSSLNLNLKKKQFIHHMVAFD